MARVKDRSNMTIARGSGTNAKTLVTIPILDRLEFIPQSPDTLVGESASMWTNICTQLHSQGLLTQHDLPSIEMAAHHYGQYMMLRNQLSRAGYIIKDDKGNLIPNPLRRAMDAELQIYQKLSAELGMTVKSRVEIEAIRLRNERLKITDRDGTDAIVLENLLGGF